VRSPRDEVDAAASRAAAVAAVGTRLRWRVEHVQVLAASDIGRFAKLGVIPSMQPSHCASDLGYATQRLGAERAARSYAWMSLLTSGVRVLPFGSDFPTAGTVPPLLGVHAAVTRQTAGGVPVGGWHAEQRVSRTQALRGYTTDAAYARFAEHELGQVRAGYLADLTIVDRDLLSVPSDELLRARVVATIVGGRAVYDPARLLGYQ
jgi:predicted amidohydrolase YtcJ